MDLKAKQNPHTQSQPVGAAPQPKAALSVTDAFGVLHRSAQADGEEAAAFMVIAEDLYRKFVQLVAALEKP